MTGGALFNGVAAPDLAFHRGLHYGDGVFRTCLIFGSEVVDLPIHMEVLKRDAARLGLEVPAAVPAEARELARGEATAVLKLILMRAQEGRGYRSGGAVADRLLCRYEAPRYAPRCWTSGVTATRGALRLARQPALAGAKHLNRLEQVLASRHWPAGIDEIILADEQDRPIGGTRTNLFWARGRTLYTPSLERCGVAGMMREKVLRAAAAAGVPVRVVDGSWEELAGADEAFLTNSLVGIWPLARLDAQAWRAPGALTTALMEQLAHPRLES